MTTDADKIEEKPKKFKLYTNWWNDLPDWKPVYYAGIMVLVPRRTYQFAVVISAICGFIVGWLIS